MTHSALGKYQNCRKERALKYRDAPTSPSHTSVGSSSEGSQDLHHSPYWESWSALVPQAPKKLGGLGPALNGSGGSSDLATVLAATSILALAPQDESHVRAPRCSRASTVCHSEPVSERAL